MKRRGERTKVLDGDGLRRERNWCCLVVAPLLYGVAYISSFRSRQTCDRLQHEVTEYTSNLPRRIPEESPSSTHSTGGMSISFDHLVFS